MINPDDLGRRTRRVYSSLRTRIVEGELTPGTQLPSHTVLATEYQVSPMTVRQVLALLEQQGMVSREQGRGTFVRERQDPAVLVVDDEGPARELLRELVSAAGHPVLEASGPQEALSLLASTGEAGFFLVLSDVRMPDREAGVDLIRQVRRRWPDLPIAAVTAHPDDLQDLHGTPECPVLIIPKPVRARQIDEVLRLATPNMTPPR